MGKLYNFLLGVVVGFGLYHAAINYHVIYADDGLHLVAKTPPRLAEFYVDVRDFDLQDVADHPEVVAALRQAGMQDVLPDAAQKSLNNAIDRTLQKVLPPAE